MADVTDATFETDVLARSEQVPVVVDLWAEWCGPCRTLGPMLERVISATDGAVDLAKVDVDANPQVAATFRVQSIPAVFAIHNRQIVDHFVGALPEAAIQEFVDRLAPVPTEADLLVTVGDEASLRRALEFDPAHEGAVVALAELLVARGDPQATQEALDLLARIPENADTRRIAALARTGAGQGAGGFGAADGAGAGGTDDGITAKLDALLDRVKGDDAARQEFVDLLEVMGPDHPRTAEYRKALTTRLY